MARNLLDVLVSRHAIFTYLLPPELQEWSAFVQYNMTDEGKYDDDIIMVAFE